MRMIYNVINDMLAEVPAAEEVNYKELIELLQAIRKDWLYKAPEQMPNAFAYVSTVLTEYLGDPEGVQWKENIRDIFADKKGK